MKFMAQTLNLNFTCGWTHERLYYEEVNAEKDQTIAKLTSQISELQAAISKARETSEAEQTKLKETISSLEATKTELEVANRIAKSSFLTSTAYIQCIIYCFEEVYILDSGPVSLDIGIWE